MSGDIGVLLISIVGTAAGVVGAVAAVLQLRQRRYAASGPQAATAPQVGIRTKPDPQGLSPEPDEELTAVSPRPPAAFAAALLAYIQGGYLFLTVVLMVTLAHFDPITLITVAIIAILAVSLIAGATRLMFGKERKLLAASCAVILAAGVSWFIYAVARQTSDAVLGSLVVATIPSTTLVLAFANRTSRWLAQQATEVRKAGRLTPIVLAACLGLLGLMSGLIWFINPLRIGAPNMPSDLTAYASENDTVRLAWKDNSDNETGFEIYVTWDSQYERRKVDANVTTYDWTDLPRGTDLCFDISSLNGRATSHPFPTPPAFVCAST